MKQKIVWALIHMGLFSGLLCILWMGLSLSCRIPNKLLYENMERSAQYYGQWDAFHFHNGEVWNAISDNYADSILLNLSWHIGTGDSPFTDCIRTNYYDGEDLGLNSGFLLSVTENASANQDYTRYWHGGALFVRLLHLVTDVAGMKWIGFAGILLLAALTVLLLWKLGHPDLGGLLLASLALVQVWNLRLSLEYQTAFLITFLLCPMYLLLERRSDRYLTLLSTAGGVLIAFFDFLTTETLTILLPLILVTAVRAKEGRLPKLKQSLLLYLFCGICWGCAYVGTFLAKWTAASLVTGENAFMLALSSVAERVGVTEALGSEGYTGFFSPLTANFTMLFGGTARVQPVRVLVGLLLLLGIPGSVWYLFPAKKGNGTAAILLLGLGSLVLLRYLVLNNHSYLHEFFTYRALSASVLALLCTLRLNIALPKRRKGGRRK